MRILKGSCKPKDNLTGTYRRSLRVLKAHEELTILPANKGNNATMVLSTVHCNRKIPAFLEDQAYRKLKKDPAKSVECKEVLLMRDFLFLRRSTNNFDPKVRGRQGFTGFRRSTCTGKGFP
jgi:hypothetical protein